MIGIDLSSRIALVTGSSGELGRVMIRTLAQAGAAVAIHYHMNSDKALTLQRELQDKGHRAICVRGDVTKKSDVQAIQQQIESELGPVDILVNNAVIQYSWKPVLEQDEADYESQFRSCVLQNVLTSKAFVPGMVQRKWGRVIGINTECAMQCHPSQSAYVSGKRGMDGVLRVLAKEVGASGVTVNQVAPGWTISDRDRANQREKQPDYEKSVALKRRGTDQEIANAVVFLASDLASFITGVYLPVCGGNVMPTI